MLHTFTSIFFFLGSIVVRGQGILYPWQIRKWSINLVVTDKTLKKIQFTKNSVYQTLLYLFTFSISSASPKNFQ